MMIVKYIKSWDFFSALPALRAEGQSQVGNLCGGLFSICIFALFVYVFFNSIILTLQFQSISAQQTMTSKEDQHIHNIAIGVGLQMMSLVNLRPIFQFRAFMTNKNMEYKQINVFPCTREYWNTFDDTQFQTLNLANHLCIQKQAVQLYGNSAAPQAQTLFFNLTTCDNATSPIPCASNATIANFIAHNKLFSRFFACSMVIQDTQISPTQKDAVRFSASAKLQWLTFTPTQSILAQIFLGTYEIITDTNFLPWTTNQKQTGYYLSQIVLNNLPNDAYLPIYVETFLMASPNSKVIQRAYGKFDAALSYVGGLFGLIFAFFAFFMMSFNKYKYELRVCEGAFVFKNSHLAKQSSFHFGKYLKYSLYDWIKTVFRKQPNWEDCKVIDEARQQANQQIDVKHLLQRISHIQQVICLLQNPHQQISAYLAEFHSLQQAKRRRCIMQYCNKFLGKQNVVTINSYEQMNSVLSFGLNLLSVENSTIQIKQQQFEKTQSQQPNMSSLDLLNKYVKIYEEKFYNDNDDTLQLNQEQINTEKQLSNSFYKLDEQMRMKLIRKIPLQVLYRLQKHNKQYQTKNDSQILFVPNQIAIKPLINKNRNPIKLSPIIGNTQNQNIAE